MISLDEYQYDLPPELIAHDPVEPRDHSRLFVYDTTTNRVTLDTFGNLAMYVAPALVVLNETKVVPARLLATRADGRTLELFILYDRGIIDGAYVEGLVNQYVAVGDLLHVGAYCFEVVDNSHKQMLLRPQFPLPELHTMLSNAGTTPLPPYITTTTDEAILRARYQTIFAATPGSVAAPTASLHFTDRVFVSLKEAGSSVTTVRLNIGLGTFAPVLPEHLTAKKLHHEFCSVPNETVAALTDATRNNRPVLAVGTTVVRTLESAKDAIAAGREYTGDTDLFIYPPYTFTYPDMLLTNFHVPRSSLMCLVDAFLQHKQARQRIGALYQYAIEERFRFFSFGDAMLIR